MRGIWAATLVLATACGGRPLGFGVPDAAQAVVAPPDAGPPVVGPPAVDPEFLDCGKISAQIPPDPIVSRLAATRVVAAGISAVTIATNDRGVYWFNDAGELWAMLDGSSPQMLSMGAGAVRKDDPIFISRMALTSEFVFRSITHGADGWTALHRIARGGGADELLLDRVPIAAGPLLAADPDHMLLTGSSGTDGTLAVLPAYAPARAMPSISVRIDRSDFTALAVDDSTVYWVTSYDGNAMGCMSIGSADKSSVMRADANIAVSLMPWNTSSQTLAAVGDTLFFGHGFGVARAPKHGGSPMIVARLAGAPQTLTPFGDWVLVSFREGSQLGQVVALYVPDSRVAYRIQLAVGLASPVLVVRDRLLFVDAAGDLRELNSTEVADALPGASP